MGQPISMYYVYVLRDLVLIRSHAGTRPFLPGPVKPNIVHKDVYNILTVGDFSSLKIHP